MNLHDKPKGEKEEVQTLLSADATEVPKGVLYEGDYIGLRVSIHHLHFRLVLSMGT